ncbi:MAG TPA: hypothetical protein VLA70_03075, partial [Nocardioides sp.]|nr:hypothetical protein [Nocardioides sp.]
MTQALPADVRRAARTQGFLVLCRVVVAVSVMCAAYFLLPAKRPDDGTGVLWLVLMLGVFA